MKRTIIAFCLFLPLITSAQNGNFIIKGKIANLDSPATVFLIYNGAINGKETLTNGEFEFTGQIGQTTEAYLTINTKAKSYSYTNGTKFYLESGNISITCPDTSLDKSVINGTNTNNAENAYKAILQPIETRDGQLETLDTGATEAQKKSPEFLRDLEFKNKALEAERREINKKFILDNPSSIVSLDALNSYASYSNYEGIKVLYDQLSPEVKNSPAGLSYAQQLEKMNAVAIGQIAPDFLLADTNSQYVALSTFKGKYVLLDFWASWCPVCRESNPGVVKVYAQYKSKNFTVLSVSLDRINQKQAWMNAIHHDGLTWTQLWDLNSKVTLMYSLTAIPQNFLIDPTGKIIARNLDEDQLAAKLAELFTK
ncbi:redoxin domain-containing protein [Mucilaginibacter sp.]